MSDEIVNRVAKSPLVTIDLESLYPKNKRIQLDIADWLHEGLLLREKEFRQALKEHDWTQYQDAYVAMHCSTDAILPGWTYILVTTFLQPYAKKIVKGDLYMLDQMLYTEIIDNLDTVPYQDQKVIIKGCSKIKVPDNAFLLLTQKLIPVVSSLMFGEACSTVPLYKRKR
ncbi:DUF2480 family protein [Flavobacteriaceae bacterium Ap0902]|nr:DUF2480 family protein [Flavobacteriaceae bacterium Ap0902]